MPFPNLFHSIIYSVFTSPFSFWHSPNTVTHSYLWLLPDGFTQLALSFSLTSARNVTNCWLLVTSVEIGSSAIIGHPSALQQNVWQSPIFQVPNCNYTIIVVISFPIQDQDQSRRVFLSGSWSGMDLYVISLGDSVDWQTLALGYLGSLFCVCDIGYLNLFSGRMH